MSFKDPSKRERPTKADPHAGKAEIRQTHQPDDEPILVVGLGGSAGALDSFKDFFSSMPEGSGAAFVIIQHLSPTHESLLPEILAKHTAMKVEQARDGAAVEPNCVYIIAPNHHLGIRDGVLFFAEPVKQDGLRLPIDFFLHSLAEDRGERAIGILLSGSGADGTQGIRAIRGAGGMVMAQDPQTAQFPDLPQSAVATGLVDYILAPDLMPEALMNYLRQPYAHGAEPEPFQAVPEQPGDVQDILALLLAQTGCDFRPYKKSTILRRIQRRMGLRYLPDLALYLGLLQEDPQEVKQLLKDLLINVTAFFRDAEAFEELRDQALAPLVQAQPMDEPLRVWVPGCATGEEAYSVAMLLFEQLALERKNCQLQVFATDIDEEALEFARWGIYPENIAVDIGPQRLAKFFVPQDKGYKINDALRQSVTFATQNLLADPPFSRMDLISCRNLLIYVEPEAQAKLMARFNFALGPGGYLFLGKSETIGGQDELFETISKTARLYRRLTPAHPIVLDSPMLPGRKKTTAPVRPAAGRPAAPAYGDMVHEAILNQFAASAVLVDRKGQILQFHGQTGKYLDLPTTNPALNLLDLAREGLATKLRLAMHQAIQRGETVVVDSVPIERGKDASFARVTVMPIARRGEAEPLLAVFFEDVSRPAVASVPLVQSAGSEKIVKELEDELSATQQDLQSTIEELQAANEELQSTNEELQSTNEELETSTEELQAANEELTTVNGQLQEKIGQLNAANNDMNNLLRSTEIATLFLDRELCIKMFTPSATKVLNLIPSDMGRPISHLSMHFMGYDLPAAAAAVAQGDAPTQKEVKHADGSNYLVRVMPYHTQEGRTDGVVITFADITRLQSMQRLAAIVESSTDAIYAKTLEGIILTWNPAAEEIYGYSAEEVIGRNVSILSPPEHLNELKHLLESVQNGERITSYETERVRKDGRRIHVSMSVFPMMDASGRIMSASTIARDITQRKQMEEALRESAERFRTMANSMPQLAWMANADGFITWYNDKWYQYTGTTPEQMEGWGWQSVHDPEVLPEVMEQWQASIATGQPFDMTFPMRGADGCFRPFLTRVQPLKDPQGHVAQWFGTNTDVDEIKRVEDALRAANEQLAEADRRKNDFLAMLAHELRNPLSPVRSSMEILRLAGPKDPILLRQREIIERQIGHMARLLDDLLDVSRITRGMIELRLQPLHLTDVLLHAQETATPLFEARRHELTVALPPDTLCVKADLDRLSQAIGNLLINAAKFTEEGGQVWLDARREDDEAVVRVRDTGAGIAPEMLPRIFDLFTQADRTLGRSKGGLGIGLTMVKNLVEMHCGRVEARSEGLGKGSEFIIRLPALEGESEEPTRPEKPGEPPRDLITEAPPRRILVVDDIADSADSLAQMLSLKGHEARAVYDGPAALEAAQAFRPEVVLLDIGMPEMDGYEVARRLRADYGDKMVLVALTGYAQASDREAARAAGFDHHLAKPVDLDALRGLLASIRT